MQETKTIANYQGKANNQGQSLEWIKSRSELDPASKLVSS
jgi:hypothetical protein